LEEYIFSIFRVEEEAEQETSVKSGGKQSSGFLLGLCFDPEDGGDIFVRNAG
jgi:hypothetical protein